jgi:hypothetical protein
VTSYLAAERFGPEGANFLGYGNELLGLWLDIRAAGPGTAAEWRDVDNNTIGIEAWHSEHPVYRHYYQD